MFQNHIFIMYHNRENYNAFSRNYIDFVCELSHFYVIGVGGEGANILKNQNHLNTAQTEDPHPV